MSYITLKASNGQFIHANPEQNGRLDATGEQPDLFDLDDLGSGKIALRAFSMAGLYVGAEHGGGAELIANRSERGGWEIFILVDRGEGTAALQASSGHYVKADGGGGGAVTATARSIGPEETFQITRHDDVKAALQSRRDCSGIRPRPDGDEILWDDRTHLKIVETAIKLLAPHGEGDRSVKRFLSFAQTTAFSTALYKGLKDADYQLQFIGFLWSSHFYDPDRKSNYLGFGANALTEGVRYFNKSMSRATAIVKKLDHHQQVTAREWQECGYELGVASHYLTDLTQPMHAANFANVFGNSFPLFHLLDWRHKGFEGVAEKQIANGYLNDAPGHRPEDLDTSRVANPTALLEATARHAKDIFTSRVAGLANDKIILDQHGRIIDFKPWEDGEVVSVLDVSLKPHALRTAARFYLYWIRTAEKLAHVDPSKWYRLREPTEREFVTQRGDGWVRRWKDGQGDEQVFRFIPLASGAYHIACKARLNTRWCIEPTGWFDLHAVNATSDMTRRPQNYYEFSLVPEKGRYWIYESTKAQVLGVGDGGAWDGALVRWGPDNPARQLYELIEVAPVTASDRETLEGEPME